jgi:cytidylate kinase
MTIVALSIEPGTRGRTFAAALARCLGVALADRRAFERNIAMRSDFGDKKLALFDGGSARFAANWRIREEDLAMRLREEMLQTAAHGNVLIVGWSAAAILRPLRHVACVSVRARQGYRAANIQRQLAFTEIETARLEVESEDALITRFVQRIFSSDWRDPDLYNLVLDGERVNAPLALSIIDLLTKGPQYQENSETRATVDAQLRSLQCQPTSDLQPAAMTTGSAG